MMTMPERPVIDQNDLRPAEPPIITWRPFVETTWRQQFALGVAICWGHSYKRHAHIALGFWVIGIERVALEPVAAEPLE